MNHQQALEALRLSEGTLPDEIQQRFQELMEKYSPENASPSLRSEYAEKQRELTGAYGVLTTPVQDAPPSAQPSGRKPSTTHVVSENPASNASLYTQPASKPVVKTNLDKVVNALPEVTRKELLQNAAGVQSWVRQRSNAKLNRVMREIDAQMPRGVEPTLFREQFVDQTARQVYDVLNYHDRLLLLIALTFPILPFCGTVVSQIPGLGPIVAVLFYIGSAVTFVQGILTYNKMQQQFKRLYGIFQGMVHQYVYGNLNTAKSVEDFDRIQQLVSYSLLFINDFDLNREIEQVTISESFSEGQSSGGYSVSRSVSKEKGRINPRIIKQLNRMVKYAKDEWNNPKLTDYEREQILKEFHSDLEQATKADPTEWACGNVMGNAWQYAQQKHKDAIRTLAVAAIGGFIVFIVGSSIVARMGIAAPILIAIALALYVNRDRLREIILRQMGQRQTQITPSASAGGDDNHVDN